MQQMHLGDVWQIDTGIVQSMFDRCMTIACTRTTSARRLSVHHQTRIVTQFVTLVCTFRFDIGTLEGVAAWTLHSLAIVLALHWKGAGAVVSMTAIAVTLMISDSYWNREEIFQVPTTNRAIGAETLTALALACLYFDWPQSKHRKRFTVNSRLSAPSPS